MLTLVMGESDAAKRTFSSAVPAGKALRTLYPIDMTSEYVKAGLAYVFQNINIHPDVSYRVMESMATMEAVLLNSTAYRVLLYPETFLTNQQTQRITDHLIRMAHTDGELCVLTNSGVVLQRILRWCAEDPTGSLCRSVRLVIVNADASVEILTVAEDAWIDRLPEGFLEEEDEDKKAVRKALAARKWW